MALGKLSRVQYGVLLSAVVDADLLDDDASCTFETPVGDVEVSGAELKDLKARLLKAWEEEE